MILHHDVEAGLESGQVLLQVDDLDDEVQELVLLRDRPVGMDEVVDLGDLQVGQRGLLEAALWGRVPLACGRRSGFQRGRQARVIQVFREDDDLPRPELGFVHPDIDDLGGELGREDGGAGRGPLSGGVLHDLVLQIVVRGEILDVGEVPLPHGVDDVAVLGGFLRFALDELEEIDDLVPVEALIKEKRLHPVLEEEEGEALDGHLVPVDRLAAEREGVLLDPDLELPVVIEEGLELSRQVVDEAADAGMLGGEDLHGRDGVGRRQHDLPDAVRQLGIGGGGAGGEDIRIPLELGAHLRTQSR